MNNEQEKKETTCFTTGHFWVTVITSFIMLMILTSIGYVAIMILMNHADGKLPSALASIGDVSSFFGTFSSLLAIIIAVLAVVVTVIPLAFYFLNKHAIKLEISEQVGKERDHLDDHQTLTIKSEICNLEKELRNTLLPQLEKQLECLIEKRGGTLFQETLEKHAAEQDRLRYLTEIILSKLWDKRVTRIENATKAQKLDTFIGEQTLHLKDTFTFTQLRSPEPKDVFTALGTLEHREDLPREIVKLICLLEKQGRLKDEFARQAAEAILQRFEKDLGDC